MAKAKGGHQELPHQKEGTSFLRSRERAALFDEQGLGKSKQLIDAIAAEINIGALKGALIVCPNGLKSNWADEVERFSSLPYAVFGAGRKARHTAFGSLQAAFYVINYEAVAAELPSLRALLRFKPMAMVLDESHRIKTPDTLVTKAVLALRKDATRRFLLTGTPIANKPDDLWSQIFFLDDGDSLGHTFEIFQAKYGTSNAGYQNIDQLRQRIAPLSLRRLKDHAVQLPAKQYRRVAVSMAPRQRIMYKQMRDDLALWVKSLDGSDIQHQADAVLARLVRLAQLASNPRLLDANYREIPSKFRVLDSLLRTYIQKEGRKVIIWTSFVANIAELKTRFSAYGPVTLFGEMSSRDRDRAVRLFRTDPRTSLLLANPAAAREGLTLTEANVAIYLDRTFNLVDYLQSQDRIHRISQKQECEIVLLIGKNTIDEFVDFSLEQKQRLARYSQRDTFDIATTDLTLEKPAILRALLGSHPS